MTKKALLEGFRRREEAIPKQTKRLSNKKRIELITKMILEDKESPRSKRLKLLAALEEEKSGRRA